MATHSNIQLKGQKKPSKLLALIALVVAFTLPFILVKTFPHKNKSFIDNIPLSLPAIPDHETGFEEGADDASDTDLTDASELSDQIEASTLDNAKEAEVNQESSSSSSVFRSYLPAIPNLAAQKLAVQAAASKSAINTTHKDKSKEKAKEKIKPDWTTIKIQPRDSMGKIFNRVGLNAKILSAIVHEVSNHKALTQLQVNQEIKFLIKNQALEKIIMPHGSTQFITIERQGNHYKSSIQQRKMDSKNSFLTATIQGSIQNTANKYRIPSKLIQQMMEIFTWDINFAKDVHTGDKFTIMYNAYYIDNKLISIGDIVAVSFKSREKAFKAVRHTNRSGHVEYYTAEGRSLKKAFARYPLRFTHIGSPFSLSRYHPILHYARPHKGVDLAARIGTPIQATGDGHIEIIGSQSGYGNLIKIKHNPQYSTIYGHMLKFQKGLSKGSSVKRGQIIGYVGQSGLATGPHCHYEVHVNNQARNPATVELPRGDSVGRRELAKFKSNTSVLLAHLKRYEETRVQLAKK